MALTGPRQSGKTTLLRHLFGETYGYMSMDPTEDRGGARNNADPAAGQNCSIHLTPDAQLP
ncbi:MAG: AAA family ATPase [Pseudomonadota bacterium]